MSGYVSITTKKNGKRYHYFRPPPEKRLFFGRNLRLSDVKAEAIAQAKALVANSGPQADREASKLETNVVRIMLNNAAGRSKKRGMKVSLTKTDVLGMLRAQGYCCAITRKPFNLNWRTGKDAKRNAFAPSLDRIDNRTGYTIENCRLVLSAVNYAMNEWGLDVFMELAEAAYRYSRTKGGKISQTKITNRVKPV